MLKKIDLQTPPAESLIDLTFQVRAIVTESGVQEGICVLYNPHSTAGLTINSGLDPKTGEDIISEIHRLVPTRVDFKHTYDTPSDAAGHIKSVLVGNSLTLIITQGELILGGSQSLLFFDFDGPRRREVWVRVLAEQ